MNPWSTLAAYLALTVGIGATTTIFSVLNSLLLSPLPIADAEHVARVMALDKSGQSIRLSMPDALDIKKGVQTAGEFAFYRPAVGNLADRSRPEMVHLVDVDADLLHVLGVKMAQGHGFSSDANAPSHGCEVVVAWPYWQAHFGGLPISGKTIRLNERPCQIAGVLPKDLDIPLTGEIWLATPFDTADTARNGRLIGSWYGLAHLKSGVSLRAFNAQVAAVSQGLTQEHPIEDSGLRVKATLLREWITSDVRQSLWILAAAVAGVLLMACANVANLLLARTSARLREISVRVAVGANRLMLFQQFMTESLLLALIASVSGLWLTTAAISVLQKLPNLPLPRQEKIAMDWRVMLFAVAAAAASALLFGILPALLASSRSLFELLSQANGRISESRRQQVVRKLLVGGETAIATVLLIGSLLLLRSFGEALKVNPGFQPDHLLTAYVSFPPEHYGKDTMDSVRFANKLIGILKSKAGIKAAAMATSVPLQNTDPSGPVQIEGRTRPVHGDGSPFILNTGVSPEFRRTLGIPLLAGRDLNEDDNRDDRSAVLVNSAFVKLFFPNDSAIRKRFRKVTGSDKNGPWLEIVGVIADSRQFGLEGEVRPDIYLPMALATDTFPAIIIRTAGRPAAYLKELEKSVRDADPEVPVFLPRTMEQVEARRLGSRTFNTALLTGFASVALLLAAGGIFAVIAYSVAQRTSEIGVRMACGASRGQIFQMIIRQGLLPAFGGIVAGVAASLLANRYLADLLFGVEITDIRSYAGSVAVLAVCCVAAASLPAWRASTVEPWRALRYE